LLFVYIIKPEVKVILPLIHNSYPTQNMKLQWPEQNLQIITVFTHPLKTVFVPDSTIVNSLISSRWSV